MSRFYVGQKVRKIAARRREHFNMEIKTAKNPAAIGSVGTIIDFTPLQIRLVWDGAEAVRRVMPYMIEPIYDGDQPAAFDASIWLPKSRGVVSA